MMRPDGHTVACSLIEDTIISNDLVDNCAVVGVKLHEDAPGSIPTAFVQLKEGIEPNAETANAIDDYCLERLCERERALVITFIEKVPYTLNGKVDFRKLSNTKFEDMNKFIIEDTFFEKPKALKK